MFCARAVVALDTAKPTHSAKTTNLRCITLLQLLYTVILGVRHSYNAQETTVQDVWKDVVTNRDDREPLWYQLVLGIRHQVAYGRAEATDLLPSLRDGAQLWKVNLHTVRKAYQHLRDE